MNELKEDIITKMIKDRIQDDEILEKVGLYCRQNYYVVDGIKLTPKISDIYEQLLDARANAGVIEKRTQYMDASTAGYTKDMQLMNGKNVHMHIAFYRHYEARVIANYEDKKVNLAQSDNEARQIATELIIPELNNIIAIMDKNKNKEESQR